MIDGLFLKIQFILTSKHWA